MPATFWFRGVYTVTAFLLLGIFQEGRTQEVEPSEEVPPISLDSLQNPAAIVASVGPISITAREFFFSYVFGPAFVKRGADSKRRCLDFLVNEKLLALGARERGGENDPRITANLEELAGDVATEELYRDDVLSSVTVNEDDVDRAVGLQTVTVALRWLFSGEKEEADGLSRALGGGVPFDTLFERQLSAGPVSREDRQFESTLLSLRRRTPALAAVLDTLPVRVPSTPVRGPDGWYIVRLDNLVRSPLLTETAVRKARYEVRRALMQMRSDSASGTYVRKMMLEADPVIQRRTFDVLRAYLGWRRYTAERFEEWGLANRFREEGDSVEYTDPGTYADQELVRFREGGVTLGAFLRWYALRETSISLRVPTAQAFFLAIEDLVWRMVRDYLLVARAKERGHDLRPAVLEQTGWWKDKLLYQIEKDSILRTIGWTDSTLQEYHTKHVRRFRDKSGEIRPFEAVREDVLRDWHTEILNRRLLHRLAGLRRRYPVTIDHDMLRGVPVDAEFDPRAIEFYAVKKDGTFPHPAFPAIDHFWQTWD